MPDSLTDIALRARDDLEPHLDEFDAIVCAGDMHGAPIAGAVAAMLNKPLMIVCTERHDCCVSHIVTIGDVHPSMRFLYVDDWFSFGASMRHTLDYMNQSAPANVTATYAAALREYKETAHEPA